MLAGGLYHTGVLGMVQSVSRSYELRSDPGRAWPRWRKVSSPKFVILCYHRVGTRGVPLYSSVPPEVFEAQIRFLRRRYRVVSLDTLCAELEDPDGVEQSVAITFDDGYRDIYTEAFPILQNYRVPATIFATVGSIETGQVPWYDRVFLALQVLPAEKLDLELDRPRRFHLSSPAARFRAALDIVACLRNLPDGRRKECCAALDKQTALPQHELADRMLTWEQIQTMHRAGIRFGSHTVTHPVVSRLAPAEMERELVESKQILEEKVSSLVRDFAYPFGQLADCGSAAGELLVRCGYRSAVTTIWGINTPGTNPYALRRVQIGEERSLAMFAFKLNQLFLHCEDDTAGPGSVASPAADEAAGREARKFTHRR